MSLMLSEVEINIRLSESGSKSSYPLSHFKWRMRIQLDLHFNRGILLGTLENVI